MSSLDIDINAIIQQMACFGANQQDIAIIDNNTQQQDLQALVASHSA